MKAGFLIPGLTYFPLTSQRRMCGRALSKSCPQCSGTSGHPRQPAPRPSPQKSPRHVCVRPALTPTVRFSPADQPGPSVALWSPDVPVRFPTRPLLTRAGPQAQTSRAELPHALRARQPSTSGSASPGQVAWPLEAPFLHQRNGSNSDVRPQTGRHRGQALSTELWPVGAARHLLPHTHLPRGRQAAFGPAPLPGRDLKSGNQVWGQFQSLSAGHCQRRRPPQPLGP